MPSWYVALHIPSCGCQSSPLNRLYLHLIFFNVGPPKEDIFSGHLLSPVFQSSLHITPTLLEFSLPNFQFAVKFCNIFFSVQFYYLLFNFRPTVLPLKFALNFNTQILTLDLIWACSKLMNPQFQFSKNRI